MASLSAGTIGDWTQTILTRFIEDWFRNHELPATKAIQVDALTIGTQAVTAVADPADLATVNAQVFSGPLDVTGLTVGGKALPGSTIGYDQITAPVNVTATTQATAVPVIPGSAHTFDGSAVWVEFFSPTVITSPAAAGSNVVICLFEGSTCVALLTVVTTPAAAVAEYCVLAKMRFTPSAGSHTYSVKAFAGSATGPPSIQAGAAGSGVEVPAYLSFTKA